MDPMDVDEHGNSSHEQPHNNFSQLSENQKEVEFRKQHQEYISEKIARKKQLMRQIKAEFGTSSSDDSDDDVPIQPSQSSRSSLGKNETNVIKQQQTLHTVKQSAEKDQFNIITPVKKAGEWEKETLMIESGRAMVMNSFVYQLKNVSKIKMIVDPVMGVPFRIKLTYHHNDVLFASQASTEIQGLPSHYYIFARIIQQKMLNKGVSLKECVNEKVPGVPNSLIANSYISGKLNKKSQVLGKWEERFIVINKEGIFSYRKFNEKHSMSIDNGCIKQLWTRFEQQENLIIFKIHHGSKKTEFGLPLSNFLSSQNWLFHFYLMMSKK